ncbi:hypothetical protein ZIOFF_056423 [Zingiber officinale]|uniref:Carboxypeptidase n=1 Tax=Zingiber officinale TaxID=94328 RepID=A0A8J5FI53_ZINOF|nr:hypothetical protein ZIOFF_056423 [Zingiber officinale]
MKPSFNCLFLLYFLHCVASSMVRQRDALNKFYFNNGVGRSSSSSSSSTFSSWASSLLSISSLKSKVYDNSGLKEGDKVVRLLGQLEGVNFDQYAGYVTVDRANGRALFYYFAEAIENSRSKPIVLWLNGGPGCSSLGYGAMEELGPFRVMSDGKTLYRNPYAWNEEYKGRDFFITGESYAGHYVPQLAHAILHHKDWLINLKGIAIGNAVINKETDSKGTFDYFWTHALIADETIRAIHKFCNFSPDARLIAPKCDSALDEANLAVEELDVYNIYAPLCFSSGVTPTPKSPSIENFDPCTSNYVEAYLNNLEVQKALHANITKLNYTWSGCSGDIDGVVPVTSTRYSLKKLKLKVKAPWRAWMLNSEVGGYTVMYDHNLTFATIRGAGHEVPSYQPARALEMIKNFLQGLHLPAI